MKSLALLLAVALVVGCTHDEPTATPVATQLALTAPSASLTLGSNEQLTVQVFDQDGSTMTFPSVTYSTSDTAVLRVDANGTVTGVAPGTARVTATVFGLTAQVMLTVTG